MLIKLENITKTFVSGKVETPVLHGIDLEVDRQDFCAITGPSGTGKSTLMHILGLLEPPTSGRYLLDGEDVTILSDSQQSRIRNKKFGFVFQSFNLLPRATALENVLLPLVYADPYPRNAKRRAVDLLERVGLGDRLNYFPGELSGGQKQRVAIARALINSPDVIFADEPTGNLDRKAGFEIMAIFQELNRQGNTIILVTHEDFIARHAKKILELHYGKIKREETVTNRLDAREELKRIEKEE
ncbi:MAG TPA: ABC transporter ATP-binding protein [Deltaproteobacteria bacterium]|nr:ABC transporter ATP-binding protein [Deltaproteobacteria bacterium]